MSAVKATPTTDILAPVNAPTSQAPTVPATDSSLFKGNINFGDFKKISTRDLAGQRGGGGGSGVHSISIVNHEDGRRVSLSPLLHFELGSPTSVQVAVDDNSVYIGATIPGQDEKFRFTKKGKSIIYHAGLVRFLTKEFNLTPYFKETSDGEGVSSLSFRKVDILTEECDGKEIKIAKILMDVEDFDSDDE